MQDVSIVPCGGYAPDEVLDALRAAIAPLGGLDWVQPGMRIALKVNLISMMKPDAAATTHPEVIAALTRLLQERGASVVVGDSPGGPFTQAYVGSVYRAAGMQRAEEAGAELNRDFSVREAEFPQAAVAKRFEYTGYLAKADAVINVCKLKTHGMMAMTAAAKNLFGTIPGVKKAEYHYRYPETERFAGMLVDLNEYFRPRLCIVDAVVAMEGNGPTQGKPRKLGALLASACPHSVDMLCAKLIGLNAADVPTLAEAVRRGLIPESADALVVHGDYRPFVATDFELIRHFRPIRFYSSGKTIAGRLMGKAARIALETKPGVFRRECVGCGKCMEVCPAKAITMRGRLPVIDRKKCIRCFCCQELCPKGAMKAMRPAAAKLLEGRPVK